MIFKDNKYTRWYYEIVDARRLCPLNKNTYSETHHIVPESFYQQRSRVGPPGWLVGNPESPGNLVALSAREHALCHWLLTKMTENVALIKCQQAFDMMGVECESQGRTMTRMITRAYERNKIEIAKIRSERMKTNNVARMPGVGEKIAKSKRGKKREEFSDEWLNNLSKNHASKKPGFDGTRSKKTRKLLSELASRRTYSQETNDKRRDASSGRKEITDGMIYKKVKVDELQMWLNQGWIVKGKPRRKKQPA